MSRRGNCHDNAVAESFFQLLKWERIRRRIYADCEEARCDVFNYIETFYDRNAATATLAAFLRYSSNNSLLTGSGVSRSTRAIHSESSNTNRYGRHR
jgi:transposase InsO family protein